MPPRDAGGGRRAERRLAGTEPEAGADPRAIERELRASEARFRALTENAQDAVIEFDSELRAVYVNSAVRALGYEPEELVGGGLLGLLHPDDLAAQQELFWQRLRGERVPPVRHRVRRRDGGYVWYESSARLFRTASGELHAVVISRDVSESMRAEAERVRRAADLEEEVARRTQELERANRKLRELHAQLIRSERLGAAEELAGKVVHAVNSPLTALIGTVHMALEAQGGEGDPHLERIQRLAERVKGVVDRTLQLFRRGKLNLALEQPADVLADVEAEIAERARAAGIRIVTAILGEPLRAEIDRVLLGAALVSIADNAIDAMADGGTLWLELETLAPADVVAFRISDTGPGIPAELRERVFEAFFTTRRGGTGVGLAIARGVVLGHRGRIWIGERPGGGSAVHVEIPASGRL